MLDVNAVATMKFVAKHIARDAIVYSDAQSRVMRAVKRDALDVVEYDVDAVISAHSDTAYEYEAFD